MNVQDRFLNYVSYWTTSKEDEEQIPSTSRQFELAKLLEQELKELGLSDILLDEHCYLYAHLPATDGYTSSKSVGFIAHMDTSPDMSGENVKPQIIKNYDGNDVILKHGSNIIKTSDFPYLSSLKGKTLITTDGSTLLGADDKAGIAEIITALEELITSGTPHGDLWIGFTPDEEVGRGADLFNLDYFKADFAYTVDGDYEGEVAFENFNAASASFEINGVSVHPGSAKNIMKNAASIACELHGMLPEAQTPEHTENREGFFHLHTMGGDVCKAHLEYIIRDHDKQSYEKRIAFLHAVADFFNQKYGNDTVTLNITESYRNMIEVIEKHEDTITLAKEAISSTGLTPISTPVRGGTDGARLSFMGLPCPNLGTGGNGFHGPLEHIAVESMETVVSIIKYIATHC